MLERSQLGSRGQDHGGEEKGSGCYILQQTYGTRNIEEEMTAGSAQREDTGLNGTGVSPAQPHD